jgi:hypothetical protein
MNVALWPSCHQIHIYDTNASLGDFVRWPTSAPFRLSFGNVRKEFVQRASVALHDKHGS